MEEIKSFLPEELKAYQICVARWQEIDINTIRNILEKEMVWKKREWMYLCALDGVPDEKLEEMIDWELAEIQEARTNFLQEKFQKSSEAEELSEGKIRQLQEQLSALQKANEELERMIKTQVDDFLRKINGEKETAEKKIQKLEERLKGETEALQKMREELTASRKNCRDDEEIIKNLKEKYRSSKEELQRYKFQQPKGLLPVPVEAEETSFLKKFWNRWKRKKEEKRFHTLWALREAETEKFVQAVFQDPKMQPEQEDYLLECLQEGDPVEEILVYGKSCFSVDQMKQLRNYHKNKVLQEQQKGKKTWR